MADLLTRPDVFVSVTYVGSTLGFTAAIEWLIDHLKEHYDLHVAFDDDKPLGSMDERMRVVLFRSVRKLRINVAKHAQTGEAKLTCRHRNEALRIVTTDEGTEFDSDVESAGYGTHGFGLFSIRERLGHLGGSMQIRTVPGSGTSVVLHVPRIRDELVWEAAPATR